MTAQKGGDPCVLNGLKGRLPRKIPFGSVHREGKKREKVGNFAEATAGTAVSHRYFFVFNSIITFPSIGHTQQNLSLYYYYYSIIGHRMVN